MKNIGIVRKVDELGRVVLPKELRYTMDISEKCPLEILIDGRNIVLRKYEPECIFCGEVEGVNIYKGKNICENCMRELKG